MVFYNLRYIIMVCYIVCIPFFLFQSHQHDIIAIGISSNGKFIMSASKDTHIKVWDLKGMWFFKESLKHQGWKSRKNSAFLTEKYRKKPFLPVPDCARYKKLVKIGKILAFPSEKCLNYLPAHHYFYLSRTGGQSVISISEHLPVLHDILTGNMPLLISDSNASSNGQNVQQEWLFFPSLLIKFARFTCICP